MCDSLLLLRKALVRHYTARGYRPLVRRGIFIEHQAALPAYSHYVLPLQHGLHPSEMLSQINVTLLIDCCRSVMTRAMDVLAAAVQMRMYLSSLYWYLANSCHAGMLTGRTGPHAQRYSRLYVADSRGRLVNRIIITTRTLSRS